MSMCDARQTLTGLVLGFQLSQAIHVAAVLNIADLLASGPMTSSELAIATGTHSETLYRLLRALASIGVLHEHEKRYFALTPVGTLLRADVPDTLAPMARRFCRPSHWQAWGKLLTSVHTGATAFEDAHGHDIWTHRSLNKEEGDDFDLAMAAHSAQFADTFMQVFNVGQFAHVVDVGGGDGTFLTKILEVHQQMRGTLFDQPHVAARAARAVAGAHLTNRCNVLGGDFFEHVPHGADAYILKWILHDWDDASSIRILRICRNAMAQRSRLLIIEHIVGPPNSSPRGMFMDINMLVITGGRERTRDEFASLLAEAGLVTLSTASNQTDLSVIEAVRI